MLCGCIRDNEVGTPADKPVTPEFEVLVLDYSPMPGQFVNEQPQYVAGDTRQTMRAKAQALLNKGYCVSLGAWGGSMTVRLLTPVKRDAGGALNLRIAGNAFINGHLDGRAYGSAEPGIVQIMHDTNGNLLPDDEWYTVLPVGAKYVTDFEVTYFRHEDTDDDAHYIRWEANDGTEGYILRYAAEHSHAFFPAWEDAPTLRCRGIRIADNGVYDAASHQYQLFAVNNTADSYPANSPLSVIDLGAAVDAHGNPYPHPQVDFVRVYTGVLQCNGPLGEVSTEISGYSNN